MEPQNCSAKLEKILAAFLSKDIKLSKEEKEKYILEYQETWLEFVGENGFEQQTIHYLHQSKNISAKNLLFIYLKEYNIEVEQLMKILNTLLNSKSYKDKWFDFSLEALSMCLNTGEWGAKYIEAFLMYLPYFRKNLKKKTFETNITKYMLEILQPEANLTLIDLHGGSIVLKEEFCELLSRCFKDVNTEMLSERALQNYNNLNEYVEYILSSKSVQSPDVLTDKKNPVKNDIGEKKETTKKQQLSNQDVSSLLEDWNLLKELMGHIDETFIKCIEDKIIQLQEEIRTLHVEKHELNNKYKTVQTKLNEESMAKEYADNALVDERNYSSRLVKQLKEEQESKNFYLSENDQLKLLLKNSKEELMLQEQKIHGLEDYIESLKLESDRSLQGSLNNISGKVKREYVKYMEYVELRDNGNSISAEDSILYLEHLLNKTFSVLEKNGMNIK